MQLNTNDIEILAEFKTRRASFTNQLIDAKSSRKFVICHSCGFPTLKRRGEYDICTICDWEDDGQDDSKAGLFHIGPNRISLTESRLIIGRELKLLADSFNGKIITDLDQFLTILKAHKKRMKIADDKVSEDADFNDPTWKNRTATRELIKRNLITNR